MISKSLGSSRKYHALLAKAGRLGEFAQVLFPLIVVNTDDYGRMPGDAFTVKHLVLPTSPRPEEAFGIAMDAIADVDLVKRYAVDDVVYLQVVDFEAHQAGLHKRTKSRLPEFPGDSGNYREVPLQGKGTEGKGTGKGKEPNSSTSSVADAPLAPRPVDNPNDNVSVITVIAHEAIDQIGLDSPDLPDTVKSLCAIRDIAYRSDVVRKATRPPGNAGIRTGRRADGDSETRTEHHHRRAAGLRVRRAVAWTAPAVRGRDRARVPGVRGGGRRRHLRRRRLHAARARRAAAPIAGRRAVVLMASDRELNAAEAGAALSKVFAKKLRVSEKTEQAHGVQLLRSLGAKVYVLGGHRRAGDYQGTMQTEGLPDVEAFLPVRGTRRRVFLKWECKAVGGRLRPGAARIPAALSRRRRRARRRSVRRAHRLARRARLREGRELSPLPPAPRSQAVKKPKRPKTVSYTLIPPDSDIGGRCTNGCRR
jgi:hypothetical protein